MENVTQGVTDMTIGAPPSAGDGGGGAPPIGMTIGEIPAEGGAAPPPQYAVQIPQPQQPPPNMAPVQPPPPVTVKEVDLRNPYRRVSITAHKAEGVTAKDKGRTSSDPYVYVTQLKKKKWKSSTQKKTLNPVWEETGKFEISCITAPLCVQVWDYDMIGPADFIGEVALPTDLLPVGPPDQRWHPLQSRAGKTDRVEGQILLTTQVEYIPSTEYAPRLLRTGASHDLCFINLKQGLSLSEVMGQIAAVGAQCGCYVKNQTETSIVVGRMETLERWEEKKNYSTNPPTVHRYKVTWQEECVLSCVTCSTSAGDAFLQLSYQNPKGYSQFRQNWVNFFNTAYNNLRAAYVEPDPSQIDLAFGHSTNTTGCVVM